MKRIQRGGFVKVRTPELKVGEFVASPLRHNWCLMEVKKKTVRIENHRRGCGFQSVEMPIPQYLKYDLVAPHE